MDDVDKMLAAGAAAEAVGVDPSSLRRWVREGRVVADSTTAGGHYRFVVDHLREQLSASSARV